MAPSITTLEGFLEKYNNEVELLPEGTKIRFLASNHEMKVDNIPAMLAYVHGKAYIKAKKKQENKDYDFAAHAPFIVTHKSQENVLYCRVTNTTLPKDAKLVKRHIHGRKFIHHKEEHDRKERARREREEKRKVQMEVTAEHIDNGSGNDDDEKVERHDSDVERRMKEFTDSSENSTPDEEEVASSSEAELEKEQPMDMDDGEGSHPEMHEEEDEDAFWIRTSAQRKKGKKEWDDDDESDDSSSDSAEDGRSKSKRKSRKAKVPKKVAKSKSKSKENGSVSKPPKAAESKRKGRSTDDKIPKKVRPSAKRAKT